MSGIFTVGNDKSHSIMVHCHGNGFILSFFQIQWGACGLVIAGNVVVFLTILGYFIVFASEDLDYSMW